MQVFGAVVTRCYCCLHLVTFLASVKDLLPERKPHYEIPQTQHPPKALPLWTCVAEQACDVIFLCPWSVLHNIQSFNWDLSLPLTNLPLRSVTEPRNYLE